MAMFEPEIEEIPELREVAPALPVAVGRRLYDRLRDEEARLLREGGSENFADALRELIGEWDHDPHSLMLRTTCLLVADLIDQGWAFQIGQDRVTMKPPGLSAGAGRDAANRSRTVFVAHCGRGGPATARAVGATVHPAYGTTLQARRGPLFGFDLIDDGRELERLFLKLRRLPREAQEHQLRRLVDPVVELCETGSKCAVTGLNRIDIWRYFRHTWSLEYRPIPGRQLPLLIRNAARPNRPVIGIALLASPVMRLRIRDSWIGWTSAAWARGLSRGGWDGDIAAAALMQRLDGAIEELRWTTWRPPMKSRSRPSECCFVSNSRQRGNRAR